MSLKVNLICNYPSEMYFQRTLKFQQHLDEVHPNFMGAEFSSSWEKESRGSRIWQSIQGRFDSSQDSNPPWPYFVSSHYMDIYTFG